MLLVVGADWPDSADGWPSIEISLVLTGIRMIVGLRFP